MPLTSLPVETLIHIFWFSCTDYSQTGFALHLVCKLFHTILKDTGLDIQSVAVLGSSQLSQFADTLRSRRSKGISPRVRKLFLSNANKNHFSAHPLEEGDKPRIANRSDWLNLHREEALAAGSNTVALVIGEILSLIEADYLVTLSLVVNKAKFDLQLLPNPFPNLIWFSIYAPVTSTNFSSCFLAPNLRYLHIAHFNQSPPELDEALATFAPNLTTLNLTLRYLPSTPLDLLWAWARLSRNGLSPPLGSHWPQTLKEVVLRFRPYCDDGRTNSHFWHRFNTTEYRRDLRSAHELATRIDQQTTENKLIIEQADPLCINADEALALPRQLHRKVLEEWMVA